jgi:hypothetical protein
LKYFTDIWDTLWPFGTFFLILVSWTKKYLATLLDWIKGLKNFWREKEDTLKDIGERLQQWRLISPPSFESGRASLPDGRWKQSWMVHFLRELCNQEISEGHS